MIYGAVSLLTAAGDLLLKQLIEQQMQRVSETYGGNQWENLAVPQP